MALDHLKKMKNLGKTKF
jgi:hypothetical protein